MCVRDGDISFIVPPLYAGKRLSAVKQNNKCCKISFQQHCMQPTNALSSAVLGNHPLQMK